MSESEYIPEHDDAYWPGEWIDPDELDTNDWNPNELDGEEFERLVKSIEDNGWTMPIVVHAEEQYIIDGEHRMKASEHLPDDPDLTPEGVPSHHVPIHGITVGKEQAKLATVQHNRARGEVQVDRLQDYLEGLQDRGVLEHVHDRIGYDEDDADELLGTIDTPELPDETMPWEDDEEPSLDEEEDEDPESPIPELHTDRSKALRGNDVPKDVLTDAETITEALSETEYDMVCNALGETMRAQSLINIARYADDHDIDLSDV